MFMRFASVLAISVLAVSACKQRTNSAEVKDIDSIDNAGKLNGQTMWTVKCASGWVNEDGTDRALIPTSALNGNVDTQYCTKRLAQAGGGNTPGNPPPNNPPPNNPPPNNGGGLSFDQCQNAPATLKELTVIVSPDSTTDIDELCIAFADSFGGFLKAVPEIFKFLKESRSVPAKIMVGKSGSNIEYKSNVHRLHVPWDIGPVGFPKVTEAIAAAGAVINGMVRLAANNTAQVLYTNKWYDVCENAGPSGNSNFPKVFCRQLGKNYVSHNPSTQEVQTGPHAIIAINCTGAETWVTQCAGITWTGACDDDSGDSMQIVCQ